jgi:hypothetical protein
MVFCPRRYCYLRFGHSLGGGTIRRTGDCMKFKEYYDMEYARLISAKIKTVYSAFADETFLAGIGNTLKDQEFSDRMDLFAHAINHRYHRITGKV